MTAKSPASNPGAPYRRRSSGDAADPSEVRVILPDEPPRLTPGAARVLLRILELDPVTAAVVERIFSEFLSGRGIFAIAEGLTADGIPSPSAYDRTRNRHRCGIAWSKSAVRTILMNLATPADRVWNRQRKDEVLIDVDAVALGHTTKTRWNPADKWVWSEHQAHEPIVTLEIFEQAQEVLATRGRGPTAHRPHPTRRPYAFRGVLFCGYCDRRMQGNWNNKQAYYRCRFPEQYALANRVDHPKIVYVREPNSSTPSTNGSPRRSPPRHWTRPSTPSPTPLPTPSRPTARR